MIDFLLGLFIGLHGLVHLWYVTLSQELVEYQPDMGWTAESWLLSPVLPASSTGVWAGLLHGLAALALVAAGAALMAGTDWWRTLLLLAAPLSAAVIVLFWDGDFTMLVEKGLLGLLINAVIIAVLLLGR
ncbi:MAG: hypothetical protein R3300_13320 [Candidatus Promineifilaceae bacterium]|nr:hypothetical protein [Candidatus Promineifilaceae bacterium]